MSRLLKILFEDYDVTSPNITFFFTTCDVISLSAVLAMSIKGVKNIYMTQCLPTVINPMVFTVFENEYHVKAITTVKNDLKEIREE